MYTSKYFTCEQIDQRLLQGYLDDYNSTNGTNLTKEEFLQLIYNKLQDDGYISYKKAQSLTEAQKVRALSNLSIVKGKADFLYNKLRITGDNFYNLGDLGFIGVNGGDQDKILIQSSNKEHDGLPILIRSKGNTVGIVSTSNGGDMGRISLDHAGVHIKYQNENYVNAGDSEGKLRLSLNSPSHIFSRSKRFKITSNVIRVEFPGSELPNQDNKVVLPGGRVEIGTIFEFHNNKLLIGGNNTLPAYIGSRTGSREIGVRGHGLVLESRTPRGSDTDNTLVLASYKGQGATRVLGPMSVKTQHLIIDNPNNDKDGLQKTVLVNDRVTLVAGPIGYKPTNGNYEDIVKEREVGNSGTSRFTVTHEKIISAFQGSTWLEVNVYKVKIAIDPRNNITIYKSDNQGNSNITFYQEQGKFLFKYKDSNNQDIVLDLLAKIAELENRISQLENN